jgi:hypothetical protein
MSFRRINQRFLNFIARWVQSQSAPHFAFSYVPLESSAAFGSVSLSNTIIIVL